MPPFPIFLISLLLFLVFQSSAPGQAMKMSANRSAPPAPVPQSNARDREIAIRFAPVFYQALGDDRRSDYITNFDFDGDWRGDNNWVNTDDTRFKLRAYVYFAVSETLTHYFVHYAVFHPRDYKGGKVSGPLLNDAIREGLRRGGRYDPTGLSKGAVLAHENDMEGCLVVAVKDGGDLSRAKVVLVETLAHDNFLKYATEEAALSNLALIRLEAQSPLLYIEPKGHGIFAYTTDKQSSRQDIVTYKFRGQAGDPEATGEESVGYELLPLFSTLWPRAQNTASGTFASVIDYGVMTLNVADQRGRVQTHRKRLGKLGAAFLGRYGAMNAARPPWGWFDRSDPRVPLGSWFFDPASTVKRHHHPGDSFSTIYLHSPFVGIIRK